MRTHIYTQELTKEVRLISKTADTGIAYHGVQFILHSSPLLHHSPDDDDRSAVTFWVPSAASMNAEDLAQLFETAATLVRSTVNQPDTAVDVLANIIRTVDGKHDLGAGALAEALVQQGVRPMGRGTPVDAMSWPVGPESLATHLVDPDVTEAMDRLFVSSIEGLQARLRNLIDDLDRSKQVRSSLKDMLPDYNAAARDVLRDFRAMLGNTMLEQVVRAGQQAHDYARGREDS